MKIEIKPTGYRRVRFIGIDVLLPYIEKCTKKHFEIRLVSPKNESAKCIDMVYLFIFIFL